ncbi:hypothetical protein Tco_1064970 [Tanacetum coccineum]
MELEKNKAKVALLKAQPSFPNVGHLNELLAKSFQTEFSKILSAHDFSSSLPTKLKDLSSKFNELTKEVKGLKQQVHELEIELPRDLKEIPSKLEDFTKTVALVQAKLKTLDALPGLFLNVTKVLNKFAQVLDSTLLKAGDQSVSSAGQADTMPAKKNAEKENLNNQQPNPTPPPATTIIPPIITTTTTQMQSPPQNPQKNSSQPEGEYIKNDKGKKAMSSKDTEEDLKKFDFVTKHGEHVHLTKEQISAQKKIEEEAKAEAARCEGEMRKE